MLRALIFDVDGTLAETERDGHRIAFNQAFAEAGLEWYWSENLYGELTKIGGGKERIAHYIAHYIDRHLQDFTLDCGSDRQAWIAQLHQRKSFYYGELLRQGNIQPRWGVLRLLQEARAEGLTLAIATTSALPNALGVLQATIAPDSPEWFAVIAAGDIVAQKKPAPDIYRYTLAQLQLQPEECLVFEDSQGGLEAARAAGMTTIVTLNDYTQDQDFSAADLVVNHLGEPDRSAQILYNPHHYIPPDYSQDNPQDVHPDLPQNRENYCYITVSFLKDFLNFLRSFKASSAD